MRLGECIRLIGVVNTHQCDDADLQLVEDTLIKIVASFSSNAVFVCINYDHQNRVQFNLCALNKRNLGTCLCDGEFDAPLLF
jgi:hypothetical protein